ncbi:MAG: hypothetical protein COU07_01975 [Candidatus Harrisonbacteria bacterium CG10_big_fil_rev_8_21_14_0_10_40_38]|uniref:DNA polymerase III subunit delta n=1 Tax=Candidatus Harrisonbacteria bacterium CG10_big_fil_rev_8_21_14_0_10_40_38 TaxID=1974583 RepID=A0A2H0US24_9BACT|nr:MAG: hypothetical protein COU07_01975 [Candidatus Harrisonbacteria bacterium CG10_big_fil_rev_8_21_14_0_10_40_38]
MAAEIRFKKDFERLLKNDRLHHAYILFGRAKKSHEDFINWLCLALEGGSDGEFFLDAKFIDAKKSGGIDSMKEAISFLWKKPVKSLKRTLFVSSADNLTLEAQQAILKISEEPPPHGLIFLSVPDPESLIGPLVSRFQKLYFGDVYLDFDDLPESVRNNVKNFFKLSVTKEKTELLKSIVEAGEPDFSDFVYGVVLMLRRDIIHNAPILKELARRIGFINRFNTNRRLQLEAALLSKLQ